jgi:hypothetical protein
MRWVALAVLLAGGCGGVAEPTAAPPGATPSAAPSVGTPTASPPSAPPGNQPPQLDARIRPRPIAGTAPLTVSVDLCRTTDPDGDRLRFAFEFALEGKTLVDACAATFTYTAPLRTTAWFCATDGQLDHLVCTTTGVAVD